jgi:catechol 2,3-dioxygenase-like lactoylglutathione lyase family enzyme
VSSNPIKSIVAFVHVASVPRSIAFYEKLGFTVRDTFVPDGDNEPAWAYLEQGTAELMVARASDPVNAHEQAIFFYVYCDDVQAKHDELAALGLNPGPVIPRFYNPKGEFRLMDPDGYLLMVTHT